MSVLDSFSFVLEVSVILTSILLAVLTVAYFILYDCEEDCKKITNWITKIFIVWIISVIEYIFTPTYDDCKLINEQIYETQTQRISDTGRES